MSTNEQLAQSIARTASPWDRHHSMHFPHPPEYWRKSSVAFQLLLATREMQASAVSHRDFFVAAGALAVRGEHDVGWMYGYNIKPDLSETINIHAEDVVLAKAKYHGYEKIAMLAVVGQPQEDHYSGKHPATLHPCGRCRPMLANDSLMSRNSGVVTATPDGTAIEFGTLQNYLDYYDEAVESGPTLSRFDAPLEHFSPLPLPENGVLKWQELGHDDEQLWHRRFVRPFEEQFSFADPGNL